MSFTDFNKIAESKNQVVKIEHVATRTIVSFAAFMTEYSDNYQVQWGNEQVFGRNDPVKPYQSTTRQMQIGFDVLSHSFENAKENLAKFQTLVKMLYPVYSEPLNGDGGSVGRTIKAPPLTRIKFVNFIQSAAATGPLLGCIEGLNFNPAKDAGYFVERSGEIYPKHFNINFRFSPQHESPLGWDSATKEFITDAFPYSASPSATTDTDSGGDNRTLNKASADRALS